MRAGVRICRIIFLTGASNNHNNSFPFVLSISSFCALHQFRRAQSCSVTPLGGGGGGRGLREGGGSGNQKFVCQNGLGTKSLCVKMAQSDFPNSKLRFSPRWPLWSGGGGPGVGWGGLLQHCTAILILPWGRGGAERGEEGAETGERAKQRAGPAHGHRLRSNTKLKVACPPARLLPNGSLQHGNPGAVRPCPTGPHDCGTRRAFPGGGGCLGGTSRLISGKEPPFWGGGIPSPQNGEGIKVATYPCIPRRLGVPTLGAEGA